MMQSNQPYQKVSDGLGNGFIAGSLLGAGAVGGFHAASRNKKMFNKMGETMSSTAVKSFGSGKGRTAAVYGGVSVLGGLLGMGADSLRTSSKNYLY